MKFDVSKLFWVNRPKEYNIIQDKIVIKTEPETDFWQKTYYGFSHDNAHALLMKVYNNFTFSVATNFNYSAVYDQCGVIIYQDSDNWCKASIEFESSNYSRLGSVVTNLGYSDWATTDIPSEISQVWYRISRRGQDFLIENSNDGVTFSQMRIFHLNKAVKKVNVGIYACSPSKSSFTAMFTNMDLTDCLWNKHIG